MDRSRACGVILVMEPLEDRRLLSTITWNTTAAPTGGNWDVNSNWVAGIAPRPTDIAKITGLKNPGAIYLEMNAADSVSGLITDSTTNIEIVNGSLSLGVSSSSGLGGSLTVEAGAALNVGVAATLNVGTGQTLTVAGALSFSSGDVATMEYQYTYPIPSESISVSGSLSSNGATFKNQGNGSRVQ